MGPFFIYEGLWGFMGGYDGYERFMGMAMAISNNITITTVNRTVI
jgi:hypothetical protein